MAEALLKNIWKYYNDGVPAVSDLNLEIKDEEFVCLLGPSGCGKSSTLRMIAGLETVSKGRIFIGGRDVTELPPKERDIAMAFENYALYPSMTVYQNIAFPLEIRKTPAAEIKNKVMQAAELMGIIEILGDNVKDLSGGAKQRVGVARALVRNPQVLLLDEPISHLEEELKAKMREELRKLQRALKVTTVYVTHDQIEAMVMADRIAIMNRAVLQQFDTPETVFRKPRNMFVGGFIGEPPMNFIHCELFEDNGKPYLANADMRIPIPADIRKAMKVRDPSWCWARATPTFPFRTSRQVRIVSQARYFTSSRATKTLSSPWKWAMRRYSLFLPSTSTPEPATPFMSMSTCSE